MSKLVTLEGLSDFAKGLDQHCKDLILLEEGRAKAEAQKIREDMAKKSDDTHTHKYAGSSSVGGAANSAYKVNSNLVIQLNGGTAEGSTQYTFNGSAGQLINITPDRIGAETKEKTVNAKVASNNVLTLDASQFQKALISDNVEIVLPNVSKYTEITLFVKDCDLSNIILPDNCKWRVDLNLQSGKSFIFTFIYTTEEWLAEVKVFS